MDNARRANRMAGGVLDLVDLLLETPSNCGKSMAPATASSARRLRTLEILIYGLRTTKEKDRLYAKRTYVRAELPESSFMDRC